jgi:hypothetical protein
MRFDAFSRWGDGKLVGKLAGALFAVATLAAMPASAQSFLTKDSLDNGELVTTLPSDGTREVVYSIDVGSLSESEVLVVMSEVQVTNDTTGTQRVSAQIIRTNSSTSTTGTGLDYQNDRNVTVDPGLHHMVRVKGGIKQFSGTQTNHIVNLVAWATGNITVNAGGGRLQALKITP